MATHHVKTAGEEFILPQETVNLMREWVQDCQWGEDPEDIALFNAQMLAVGIQRHYDGGFRQFLRDSEGEFSQSTGIGPVKAHYFSGRIEDVTGDVLEAKAPGIIAALPPLAEGSFYCFHRERWGSPHEVEALR